MCKGQRTTCSWTAESSLSIPDVPRTFRFPDFPDLDWKSLSTLVIMPTVGVESGLFIWAEYRGNFFLFTLIPSMHMYGLIGHG